jgi:zinc D-Ala-D-Ala carboxypeptidase
MRLRILPVLVAIAAGLVAGMPLEPPSARAIGPVPECRIDDIYTVPRGYDDWSVTLVDWLLRVEDDYVPPDLVPVSEAGLPGGGMIREVAIDDTREMAEAAAAAGAPIGVWSPYRSYEEQVQIFTGYSNQFGYDDAITYSARPGHSEHQLGLGVDFMSAGEGSPLQGDWATTPAGAWMRDNSWRYGWVNSYPLGPPENPLWNEGACFHYEPWHYRYLGREVAAAVHESGLTIREYLWTNYTMVDPETGEAIATASPTPTPMPSPSPTATSTASPEPSATETPTATTLPSPTPPPSGTGVDLNAPVVAGIGLAAVLLLLVPIVVATRRRG